jgi:hypothetical protein
LALLGGDADVDGEGGDGHGWIEAGRVGYWSSSQQKLP